MVLVETRLVLSRCIVHACPTYITLWIFLSATAAKEGRQVPELRYKGEINRSGHGGLQPATKCLTVASSARMRAIRSPNN